MMSDSTFGSPPPKLVSDSEMHSDSDENVGPESFEKSQHSNPKRSSMMSRWKNPQSADKKNIERIQQAFDETDSSMERTLEEKWRARRRPFSRNLNAEEDEKRMQKIINAFDDTKTSMDESVQKELYKRPKPLSKYKNGASNGKRVRDVIDVLDNTEEDSINKLAEERSKKRPRSFSKKWNAKEKQRKEIDVIDDETDNSLERSVKGKMNLRSRAFSRNRSSGDRIKAIQNAIDISETDESVEEVEKEEEEPFNKSGGREPDIVEDVEGNNLEEEDSEKEEENRVANDSKRRVPEEEDNDSEERELRKEEVNDSEGKDMREEENGMNINEGSDSLDDESNESGDEEIVEILQASQKSIEKSMNVEEDGDSLQDDESCDEEIVEVLSAIKNTKDREEDGNSIVQDVVEISPANNSLGRNVEISPANNSSGANVEISPVNNSLGINVEISPANNSSGANVEISPVNNSSGINVEISPANNSLGTNVEIPPANNSLGRNVEISPENNSSGTKVVEKLAKSSENITSVENLINKKSDGHVSNRLEDELVHNVPEQVVEENDDLVDKQNNESSLQLEYFMSSENQSESRIKDHGISTRRKSNMSLNISSTSDKGRKKSIASQSLSELESEVDRTRKISRSVFRRSENQLNVSVQSLVDVRTRSRRSTLSKMGNNNLIIDGEVVEQQQDALHVDVVGSPASDGLRSFKRNSVALSNGINSIPVLQSNISNLPGPINNSLDSNVDLDSVSNIDLQQNINHEDSLNVSYHVNSLNTDISSTYSIQRTSPLVDSRCLRSSSRKNRSVENITGNALADVSNTSREQSQSQSSSGPAGRARRKQKAVGGYATPSFSAVTQKKKKSIGGKDFNLIEGLVKGKNQPNNAIMEVDANGSINYKCPKLKKPKKWITQKLYKWIIDKLDPKYKLKSRLRTERFVVFMCDIVESVIKKEENFKSDIEDLKIEMARLKLVDNLHQFYHFIEKFLPWQMVFKAVPMVRPFGLPQIATYEKGTLFDHIL